MNCRKDTLMGAQILSLLKENGNLITATEVAHKLQVPVEKIIENIGALKINGAIRGITMEEILREGK